MFVFVIILVIVGVVLIRWLKPYLEYKKIGSYAEYKAVSKSLNDKRLEYSWYQINGFININQEAIKYLQQMSKCCTRNDLKWLNQCIDFLEEGLIKAEENDATKLFLPDPVENSNMLDALKVIKRCRKPLPTHYQEIGCYTCGEAAVMHTLFSTRVELIKEGEALKPGDMNCFIDAIKEIKNSSISSQNNASNVSHLSQNNAEKPKNTQSQPIQKTANKTANTRTQSGDNLGILSDAEKQKLQQMGRLEPVEIAYGKAKAGDSQAMMFMGMSYNLDLKNPRKAFYWMDKATKKGNDQAEYFLGTYYADGYGVDKNRTKGISIILSSASKGNKDAIDCCMNKMEMSIEEMRNCGIPV